MNRFRLSAALAATLIPLVMPVPAHAARGSFVYWSTDGQGKEGHRYELDTPPTGACEPLAAADQSAPTPIYKVQNDTDTPAAVYESKDCAGHRLMVPVKATRTAGGHGPASFNSVKFRPSTEPPAGRTARARGGNGAAGSAPTARGSAAQGSAATDTMG